MSEAAFRHAICTDPADDTARLVFADWLQENNDDGELCDSCPTYGATGWLIPPEERKCVHCEGSGWKRVPNGNTNLAAYIRASIKLQEYHCQRVEYDRRRENHQYMLPHPGHCECSRLLPEDVPCPWCRTTKTATDMLEQYEHVWSAPLNDIGWQANSTWVPECEYYFERGFVKRIELGINTFMSLPNLADIFRRHPITEVQLLGLLPNADIADPSGRYHGEMGASYDWWRFDDGDHQDGSTLPVAIFDELAALAPSRVVRHRKMFHGELQIFESPTSVNACAVLYLAGANYGRVAAGLPRLPLPEELNV